MCHIQAPSGLLQRLSEFHPAWEKRVKVRIPISKHSPEAKIIDALLIPVPVMNLVNPGDDGSHDDTTSLSGCDQDFNIVVRLTPLLMDTGHCCYICYGMQ